MSDEEKLKLHFVCDKHYSLFRHWMSDEEKLKVHFDCDKRSILFHH